MIFENLKIFSQNIQKNNFIISTILKVYTDFDIIFIQEPLWNSIRFISSNYNDKDKSLMGIVNHPNWLTFARSPAMSSDYSRVAMFINIRLASFCFSFRKDIIDHRDILLVSFFNKGVICWLMNIYSDMSHTAIKYLKNTEFNIRNLLIITGNFNICDSLWDLSFSHHSSISDDLFAIANSFDLCLSYSSDPVFTRYSDNSNNSNSVIDLIFLWCDSLELNTYHIHPDWCCSSDHAPLTVTIFIAEEHVEMSKRTIAKNSDEKADFVNEILASFSKVDVLTVSNIDELEDVISKFANIIDYSWSKYSKPVRITKHSKSWWNDKCSQDLEKYHLSKSIENWKSFWKTIKIMKREFFDLKIQEIANKKQGPWELMNWVNKHKLSVIETIKYNGSPCLELDIFWQALHSSFNLAQFWTIDEIVLNELGSFSSSVWLEFSEEEFTHTIVNCCNSSSSGPNKLLWGHLKHIIKDKMCLKNIISITNTCFELGYWSSHFKKSRTIVISKPNKSSYNSLKSFQPIVLLNTLGKLIKKIIGERLQFHLS